MLYALMTGVPVEYFPQRTGLTLDAIATPLAEARERGLLSSDPEHLKASVLGRRFLNDLLQLFMPS